MKYIPNDNKRTAYREGGTYIQREAYITFNEIYTRASIREKLLFERGFYWRVLWHIF